MAETYAPQLLKQLQLNAVDFYREFTPLKEVTQLADNTKNISSSELFNKVHDILTVESLKPLIQYELTQYTQNGAYASPAGSFHSKALNGWTLLNRPKLLVILLVFDAVAFRAQKMEGTISQSIHFQAGDMALKILKSDGFTCSHWEAPLICDQQLASSTLQCKPVGTKTYQTNDVINCKGGRQTLRYESMRSSSIILQTYSRNNRTNVITEFNPTTHRLMGVSAADQYSSRLQVLNTVLRLYQRKDAVGEMRKLLKHKDHFVRWQTARELTALVPDEAEDILIDLAIDDPNAHVRATAQKNAGFVLRLK